MILNYSFAISWKTVDKNKPNVLNLYSNSLNHQFVVSVSVRKTITPLITVCTENSLFAQVLAHLQCWLLVRFFSEQLKWSMEPVGTGCQDIPGIWLSIRQLGWVAKLFVPQMADQYNWLPTPLAWRCHRVSSPFPVESVFYVVFVCVCVCRGVYLFWGLRLEYAAGNREHVCMVFDLDYVWAHESLMEHSKTKRLHTQFCTKHTGSIFEMF